MSRSQTPRLPRAPRTPDTIYVALLRGVNVGGNNMVSMAALKRSFEQLRFRDVTTYINSGNILFRSAESDPRKVEARIDRMLAAEHGLKGKTVVRSHAEMGQLMRFIANTWTQSADWRYNVVFLRHTIDSEAVIAGLGSKPEIEQVVYCPGTLLWSARADTVTRTAMVKLASRPVYQDMTVRNLNTTTKLFELMDRMRKVS
jgi:uncharacterized protein (DUF1697 family)